MFVRENIESIDCLNCSDPMLRKAFSAAAPSIGRLTSELGEFTAHVLHYRPLLLGTASSALKHQAYFEPLSPFVWNKKVQCIRISDPNPSVDYAILECDDIKGAHETLTSAYPSLNTPGNTFILAYSSQYSNKIVADASILSKNSVPSDIGSNKQIHEQSFRGGIETDLGSGKISAVVGKDGLIPVISLHDIYDKAAWPKIRTGYKVTENHFFTYFRQFEVLKNLSPSGNQNRWFTNTLFNKKYRELRRWVGI